MAETEEAGDRADANAQTTINDLLRGNIRQEKTIKEVKRAAERALSDRAVGGMGGRGDGIGSPF